MKKMLLMGLMLLAGRVFAYEPATPTSEQFTDTMTIVSVAVTSHTTTDMTLVYDEGTDNRYRKLCVQNQDPAINFPKVICSHNVRMSTVTAGVEAYGWEVWFSSGTVPPTCFDLKPGQSFHCQATHTDDKKSNVGLMRGR